MPCAAGRPGAPLIEALQNPDIERLLLDSTAILARPARENADGTVGQDGQALGSSRGGSTEVYAAASGQGLPVRLTPSPGQADDRPQVGARLDGLEPQVVDRIEAGAAEAVVPTLSSRKIQREVDPAMDSERSLAERFRARAEQHRRVATRYEKTARNILAFVRVASIMTLLQQPNQSTRHRQQALATYHAHHSHARGENRGIPSSRDIPSAHPHGRGEIRAVSASTESGGVHPHARWESAVEPRLIHDPDDAVYF